MAYGSYSGPDLPGKGVEGQRCNRSSCQAVGAVWYNHGSHSWYCHDCAIDIGQDSFNLRDWEQNYQPRMGHPMFEQRKDMAARAAKYASEPHDDRCAVILSKGRYVCNCALSALKA